MKAKYENDTKYARLHKRIVERGNISKRESEINATLLDIKSNADEKVLINTKLLDNESYFEKLLMQLVVNGFGQKSIDLEPESAEYINTVLLKEYINEYQGITKW